MYCLVDKSKASEKPIDASLIPFSTLINTSGLAFQNQIVELVRLGATGVSRKSLQELSIKYLNLQVLFSLKCETLPS